MNTLDTTIQSDMKAIEPLFIADKGMPPVLVFHFKKVNKDIADVMNDLRGGKVKIKNGFIHAIVDPVLAENRGLFLESLATVLGAMVHIKILEKLESLVLVSEGTLQKKTKNKKAKPESINVYLGTGIDINTGQVSYHTFEKKYTTDGDDINVTLEPLEEVKEGDAESPLLSAFLEAYNKVINCAPEQLPGIESLNEAKASPLDTFVFGFQAAVQFTHHMK